jgi:streptothricin acetyltransferase
MQIRPMREADIEHLSEIDPSFVSNSYLEVETDSGPGLNHSFRLVERELCPPLVKGEGYKYGSAEQEHARRKLAAAGGLLLVVEDEGRLMGAMEVEPSDWNNSAKVWNIQLSPAARDKGIGRQLIAQAAAWAKQRGYRALMLETQTNNPAACHFYQRCGFQLAGFHTMLYTNHDIGRQEVALYWCLPLDEA